MTNHVWPDGWESVDESDVQGLIAELQREVNDQHPLFGRDVSPLAWNFRYDDVLFEVRGSQKRFAVVHFTWRHETNPDFPWTKFFDRIEDWIALQASQYE